MNLRLLENEAVAGWVTTAALHSLVLGLVFWFVMALVRRDGPSESCWFGRAGTLALLLLPLTVLAVGHLNRESAPLSVATGDVAFAPVPARTSLVIPVPKAARPVEIARSAPRNLAPLVMNGLGAVWVLGSFWLLVRTLLGAERMRRLRRQLRAPDPVADSALCAQLERLDIAPAMVRLADTSVVPFATGIFSPVVVLPADLCVRLKPHEARMILRHELAHFRNRDLAWALAQGVARILHWWNPFARSVVRQTEVASEGLCDRAALSGERGRNNKAYAHCLVDLAEKITRRSLTAGALSVTGDFRRLKRRLLWIADYRQSSREKSQGLLKLLAFSLAAALALGLTALDAGAELPAKDGGIAVTRQGTDDEAVTQIGELQVESERTTFHGQEGRILFEDVKVITPFYECRARTAEYTWDKDHPKDFDKAQLRLEGGVSAQIGKRLALSETAEIHPAKSTLQLSGFPRITEGRQIQYATAAETTAEFRFNSPVGSAGSSFSMRGPAVAKITPLDGKASPPKPEVASEPSPERKAEELARKGLSIDADETSYEKGVAIAKGNVRITLHAEKGDLEVTCEEAAYTSSNSEIIARKGVTVKLHGYEIVGEHATINIEAMSARVLGPGLFVKDGKTKIIHENSEATITDSGIEIFPSQANGGPSLYRYRVEDAILRSEGRSKSSEPAKKQLRVPRGDIYHEGWEMWRAKRFNRSLYPQDPAVPFDMTPLEMPD